MLCVGVVDCAILDASYPSFILFPCAVLMQFLRLFYKTKIAKEVRNEKYNRMGNFYRRDDTDILFDEKE
jgi:hypothetical protein